MIINAKRTPDKSLYYLGSIVLEILVNSKEKMIAIEHLHRNVQHRLESDLAIDFLYYALDWLYLISTIELQEESVKLCV